MDRTSILRGVGIFVAAIGLIFLVAGRILHSGEVARLDAVEGMVFIIMGTNLVHRTRKE